ncbi:hypothetical protein DSC45_12640 [Streptomyces sp. YIM 130001]|uniref:DUF5980 family protein n=1 Tax=Streptomyces sp. YIM 130001 TaxID=2259644 RepID=UPI000EC49919|nr:DUF5980 family protein [Streptomyces sp. YIM 130001]RII17742.1 hypothetical protein DSC45_12640 [Streptomyces sp. YIM 130001]
MNRHCFGARIVLTLTAAGGLALTGVSSASGAPPASPSASSSATSATSATWTLEQSDQEVCSRPDTGPHNFYFLAPVTGSTTKDIKLELQDLPTNVTSSGGTVHPGELNDSGEFNGFVHVAIGPTPAGEYDIKLVASDGTDTQSSPARISVRSDC